MREGYLRNPVAQRAVKLVAQGVGEAPLVASDPALARLATGRSGGQVLIEVAAAQLLLHGNAYVQVLRDADGGVGRAVCAAARAGVGRGRCGRVAGGLSL